MCGWPWSRYGGGIYSLDRVFLLAGDLILSRILWFQGQVIDVNRPALRIGGDMIDLVIVAGYILSGCGSATIVDVHHDSLCWGGQLFRVV